MNHSKAIAVGLCLIVSGLVQADDVIDVKYLGNAGVLISHGDTKIVFDPLFDNDYGYYERVPRDIEEALLEGRPPFDGLDAVFVSHNHGDHFSPERMVQFLQANPGLPFFAPKQAVDDMPIDPSDSALRDRVHAVSLDLDDQFSKVIGEIEINAVRIPHSGWPDRHSDIDNITFKVSLNDAATVLHMGDAHTDPKIFANQADYWAERRMHLAMPPYWYFNSGGGKKILEDYVRSDATFGVHVPTEMPDSPSQYPEEFQGRTLLSVPGEVKRISIKQDAK